MKLFRVAMIAAILAVAAGALPGDSWAHSPVSVGIAIGVPAPVAVYPANPYAPAYVYGPPVYGPAVVAPIGPGLWLL